MPIGRVAVLGGTSPAAPGEHVAAASLAGRVMVENGLTLLFDGAAEGPAGALATAVQTAGGMALSVSREELPALADGFLALPGGPETLGQLFGACLDAAESGEKPLGLLNTGNYYSELLKTTADHIVEQFVRETQRGRLIVDRDPAELLRAMADFRPPETRRLNS
jgi:predicted Rossmann-fold nucleotide-binding protein